MFNLSTVFRSLIDVRNAQGNPTITQQDLIKNFRSLQQISLREPEDPAYKKLYHFILDFLKKCDGGDGPELPSMDYIKDYFEGTEGNEAVLASLSDIIQQRPFVGQSFKSVVKQYKEEQDVATMERILTNTLQIANTGMDINKRNLKGIMDSISYFASETKELHQNLSGVKLESQINSSEDADEAIEEYENVRRNPADVLGVFTGIEKIDIDLKGLKNTEFMIVAAYTGHCKTTFCLNMAYRALYSGFNTAFVTLEMSMPEIRRAMYVLHSCHPLFRERHPEYAKLVGKINYNDVVYGNLTDEEWEFYKLVVKDFKENNPYGKFFVWQPDKAITTVSDVELKLSQFQYELQSSGEDLHFIILDYISLLGVDKTEKSSDYNQNLNTIIKRLKRLCLTFNNGKGIRMLSPFQTNREGYRKAKENDGLYDSTALSNAHEAERSADVIISVFAGESERKSGMLKICNLKNRRDKLFEPLNACINFKTKCIYDYAGDSSDVDIMDNMTSIYDLDS
jgi:hypothetical protein